MRVTQIVTNGENRLHGSLTAAVSLEFALLFASLLNALVPVTISILLPLAGWLPAQSSILAWVEPAVLFLLWILFYNPLRLGITGWYRQVEGSFTHPRKAFAAFQGIGSYGRAVWFGLVRSGVVFCTWFMSLLPAMILYAVVQAGVRMGRAEGGLYAWLLALFLLLTVLGVLFALFLSMGFFFTDYYYLRGWISNPFRALAASQRLMYGSRLRFVKILFCAFPYFLLCLLVAPIPYAMANIRSILAAYANAEMEAEEETGKHPAKA